MSSTVNYDGDFPIQGFSYFLQFPSEESTQFIQGNRSKVYTVFISNQESICFIPDQMIGDKKERFEREYLRIDPLLEKFRERDRLQQEKFEKLRAETRAKSASINAKYEFLKNIYISVENGNYPKSNVSCCSKINAFFQKIKAAIFQ